MNNNQLKFTPVIPVTIDGKQTNISSFTDYINILFQTLGLKSEELKKELISKFDNDTKYKIFTSSDLRNLLKISLEIDNKLKQLYTQHRSKFDKYLQKEWDDLMTELAKLQVYSFVENKKIENNHTEFINKFKELLNNKIEIVNNVLGAQVGGHVIDAKKKELEHITMKYNKYKNKYLSL